MVHVFFSPDSHNGWSFNVHRFVISCKWLITQNMDTVYDYFVSQVNQSGINTFGIYVSLFCWSPDSAINWNVGKDSFFFKNGIQYTTRYNIDQRYICIMAHGKPKTFIDPSPSFLNLRSFVFYLSSEVK